MTISGQLVSFVPSTDLDVSEMFYVDTLGFRKIDRDNFTLVIDGGEGAPVRITLVQSRGETGYTALAGGFSTSTRQSNDSGPRASTSFGTPAWIRTTTTRGPRPTGCVSRGSATPTATSSRSSRITSDAGLRPAHLPGDERDHRDPGPRVGCANWSVVPVCDIGTDQLQPLVFPHDGQA